MEEEGDVQIAEDDDSDVTISKTFTPLFVVSRPYCVRAYHPMEAEIYIESLGRGAIKRNEIPADQWRITDPILADPTICGLSEDLRSRKKLWGRYNRMKKLVDKCPPSDLTCIKRRTTLLNKYGNQLRAEPKQCYCGDFEFLQSDRTRDKWMTDLGIPVPGDD